MSLRRRMALALAIALLASASAFTQGIPGTRAHAAGRAGWDAIREGRYEEAAAAFAVALDAEPRDPSLHLGAGLAAHLQGRTTAARESLQQALGLAPSLTAASLLLGDILFQGSDIDGAIGVYEAALQHAPGDQRVASRLETLRRERDLHSGFYQSSGAHFTVLFEGPADEALASRALEVLESAYWRVGTALAIYPERVITVVLYTQEQFRDVTRSPQWAAAAYDGRIRVPVRGVRADSAELERVLTHEFTHALIQTVAPRGVPTWLGEGLAVMFEPSGDAWAREELTAQSDRLPLDVLGGSFRRLSGAQARLAYAQSAATVRALVDHGGAAAVVGLLQDLAGGADFGAAFERHMFMSFDSFVATLETVR